MSVSVNILLGFMCEIFHIDVCCNVLICIRLSFEFPLCQLLSCRYWCLKEAYVKAIGSGVGDKLDDVEFHHISWDNIFVKVAGKELKDWNFWLLELGENHSVCHHLVPYFSPSLFLDYKFFNSPTST